MASRLGGIDRDIRTGCNIGVVCADPTRYGGEWGGALPDFVMREDGKILVGYVKNTTKVLYLAVVDDIETFMDVDNSANNGTETAFFTFPAGRYSGCRFTFLKLRKADPTELVPVPPPAPILLFIHNGAPAGGTPYIRVYRSLNGLGDDFTQISTFSSDGAWHASANFTTHVGVSRAFWMKRVGLPDRIWVLGHRLVAKSGYVASVVQPYYSDNGGLNWTKTGEIENDCNLGAGGTQYRGCPGGIVPISGCLTIWSFYAYGGTDRVRYLQSYDGGMTWTPQTGGEALPLVDVTLSEWKSVFTAGKFIDTHELDGYSYLTEYYDTHTLSLYRTANAQSLGESYTLADFHLLNMEINGFSARLYGATVKDPYGRGDPIHLIAGSGATADGTIVLMNIVRELKVAIATIANTVIRSTKPMIQIIIIFAHRLTGADHLHFKLESALETINTEDEPERFGFSMDGGASFAEFPPDGLPATNPYNLIVAANIPVEPKLSASFVPHVKILEGVGRDKWWHNLFEKRTDGWWNIGREDWDRANAWEPIFEHEVEETPPP